MRAANEFLLALILVTLAMTWALTGSASVVDPSGPTDSGGRPQVDLYDATGTQRGTPTNPIYTQSASGNLVVRTAPAAVTDAALVVAQRPFLYKNITGNGTTVIKTGSGLLHSIILGSNSTGGTITVYDNTAGSGTVIMTLQSGTPTGGLLSLTGIIPSTQIGSIDLQFSTGLTVVTAGSANNAFTVIYQ